MIGRTFAVVVAIIATWAVLHEYGWVWALAAAASFWLVAARADRRSRS